MGHVTCLPGLGGSPAPALRQGLVQACGSIYTDGGSWGVAGLNDSPEAAMVATAESLLWELGFSSFGAVGAGWQGLERAGEMGSCPQCSGMVERKGCWVKNRAGKLLEFDTCSKAGIHPGAGLSPLPPTSLLAKKRRRTKVTRERSRLDTWKNFQLSPRDGRCFQVLFQDRHIEWYF